MTINQALDKLFSMKTNEEIEKLVEKLRELKAEVGGRTRLSEETSQRISRLTEENEDGN